MLLWGSNMEAGEIVTEVARPLRTARSRSRLPTRPSVKLRCVKVKCPGSKMQSSESKALFCSSLAENVGRGKTIAIGCRRENKKDILEAFTKKRHTPFP